MLAIATSYKAWVNNAFKNCLAIMLLYSVIKIML